MSKTIDDRVVSLQFNNRQFESNVAQSMSTLDKLKQKLNLPGSVKAFDNISAAAGKVNLNGISQGVDALQARFSSLDVVAVTALANITNSAVNAGKNMISSLTIDPITTGFREYELQMNSVQTILANTAHKGVDIDQVTAALDELNAYADKTIYNFAEMTRNIGTFTAAGVDLDKSVNAIKGIANLGAMSGSSAQQVNTAMYQLSQALATGRVSLMDWNSVVNAGMGGEQFQNALKRTAEHFGYNVDEMIAKYGSFRESLTQGGWLTADVLTETLNQISGAYSEADLIQQGYTADQAKAIVQMAQTAEEAATKVKTFTQLISTLQEAAGSGWAKTWQILLGDFEEAKEFFTGLSDYFGKMISSSADARNNLLSEGFDSNWVRLTKRIEDAGVPLDTFTDKLKQVSKEMYGIDLDAKITEFGSLEKAMVNLPEAGDMVIETLKQIAESGSDLNTSTEAMTDKLEYFQKVVNEVWRGDWKNGQQRIEELTAAGYDYAKVQDLVNKTVDGHKLTLEDLNETQMKAIGFTDEQVEAMKKLSAEAEKSGTSLNELINNLDRPSGRQLFLEGIFNTLKAFIEPLRAIKRAFNEVFAINGDQIYGVLAGFHRLSEAILMNEDSLDKLTRTFRGIFGVVKIFTTLMSGGLGLAFNVLTTILENFNLHILDVTAFIGDIVYAFTDWITSGEILSSIISGIGSLLGNAAGPLGDFVNKLKELPGVKSALESISNIFGKISIILTSFGNMVSVEGPIAAIKKLFEELKESLKGITWDDVLAGLSDFGSKIRTAFGEAISAAREMGPDIISGLAEGLSSGIQTVISKAQEIAEKVIEAAKAILGIHSPSTEFIEIGKNVIEGFIEGLKNGATTLVEAIGEVIQKVIDTAQNIDWGDAAFVGILVGAGFLVNKFLNIIDKFGSAFEGFGKIGESISGVFNTISDSIKGLAKAKKFNMYTDGILNIAKAIGILAASLALLTYIDQGKLLGAVGSLIALVVALGVLSKVASKIDNTKGMVKIGLMAASLGVSLMMLSAAMKIISTIDPERSEQALWAVIGMISAMGLIMIAFGKYVQNADAAKNANKVGKMFRKMATSLLIIAAAMKLLSMLSDGDIDKAMGVITSISAIFAILTVLSRISKGNAAGAGKMFSSFAIAIGILALDIKLLASISPTDIAIGLGVITACTVLFSLLIAVSFVAGENASKAGTMFLKFAAAVGLLALAIKSLSGLSIVEVGQGLAVIVACEMLFGALVGVSLFVGDNADKAGNMFLKFSAAVAILAITIKLIASLSPSEVLKGLAVIAACEMLFANLVAISLFAGKHADKAGTMLLKMSGAIAVLAIAIKLIGFLSIDDIKKGIVVVGALSAFFTVLIAVSHLAGPYADRAGTMLMKMTVPIIAIAAAIGILSLLDPAKVAIASACMSAVMAVFALIVKAGSTFQAALPSLLALSAAIAVLGTVLFLLAGLPIEQTIGASIALSTLLLSMAASLAILQTVRTVSVGALVGLAAMVVAVGLIAIILGVMQSLNVQPSMETALALSTLLLAMSAVSLILAGVGAVAPAAIAGAAAFDAIIAIIGGLMIAIGALMTYVPQCEEFLDKGIAILEKIGYGIGSFFGNIIGGFIGNIGSGLPDFATQLSDFMTNLQPFIDGANSIDPSIGESMTNLAKAILIITAADVVNGIVSFLTFGQGGDLETFGTKLAAFGEGLKQFGNEVSGIDPETIIAASKAAKNLAEMAAAIPNEGGLLSLFAGENSMADFASGLADFGSALVDFSDNCAGIVVDNVKKGVEAAKGIIGFAKEIPNEGMSLSSMIFGDNSLGQFASGLAELGTALTDFSDNCAGIVVDNVKKGVEAAKGIIGFAKEIPNEGMSLSSMIFGDNSLGQFASGLAELGTALTDFSDNCAGIVVDNVKKGVEAAKGIIGFAKEIPNEGFSLSSIWSGDNTLGQFGSHLADFGTALTDFSDNVASVDGSACETAITTAEKLVNVVKSMSGIDSSGATSFKNAINTLAGTNVSGFVSAFSGKTSDMKSIGSDLGNAVASGFKSAVNSMKSAASSAASSMASAISSKASSFKTAGTKCMDSFTTAIKNGTSKAKSAVKSMAKSAADAAKLSVISFMSAGLACATGFASGIASGAYLASIQAYAMGRAAADSAKRAIDSNSPSKVFKKIGSYVPQGFAIGIGMYGDLVKRSASDMASEAIDGTSRAIVRISDAISSDVDTQPTIRPVVDLSDVADGASAINSMFGLAPSVGVMSNVGAISSMMNNRQNGVNSDVVSAIKDLDRSIAKTSGPNYTINGITYDRGTEVADAIETLVRATRIEGRV